MIEKNYVLVNTEYDLHKGRQIVLKLMDNKINFLKEQTPQVLLVEDLRDEHISKRVAELRSERERFLNFIDSDSAGGREMEVYCELKIKFK